MRTTISRFAAVGVVNTVLDFSVFVLLIALSVPVVLANLASTSTGLAFSFAANRHFTFRSRPTAIRTVLFFLVTCAGLWAIQPVVLELLIPLLAPFTGQPAAGALAKFGAICTTAAVNYVVYSRAIFRSPDSSSETALPLPPVL